MRKRPRDPLAQRWVRDGTLSGPALHEIDLRSADYRHWITIKAADDRSADRIAAVVLGALNAQREREGE